MEASQPAPRWRRRPEGSNWGDYGPDDELGRLNLITPAKVREGLAEVREGLSFCLSLPLDLPGGSGGARQPPRLFPTGPADQPNMNRHMESDHWPNITDITCDDAVTMSLQYSTQWDSLCHRGHFFDADEDGTEEIVYYNGWRPIDIFGAQTPTLGEGVRRLGIENMAEKAIQTRAVMVDFHRHFGPERRAVSYDDMMEIIAARRLDIRPGDILCLHSGYSQAVLEMGGQPDGHRLRTLAAELDGCDEKLLQWITDCGVAAIAADTVAVETFRRPSREGPPRPLMPLHKHCLFKLGLPLGEYWWLTPLAQALEAAGRTAFLLTAPPLRLPGAVGSPVTPVATI